MVARIVLMLTLVTAGELIFGLPYQTARFFRPTLLEAFNFTNTQLGDVFAVYGLFAMLSYFPGGPIADRYSARSLLTISLVLTGLGGFYMATYPGPLGMAILYGYWGVTTILLFWSALIRATREWGGDSSQGKAFGILEGGRGVVAALIASLGVVLFALGMPEDVANVSNEQRRAAFRSVILMYSFAVIGAGVLVWFMVPPAKHIGDSSQSLLRGAGIVIRKPVVWAQAGVIIMAYCGFRALDNYPLYLVQVMGMTEVDSATIASWAAYLRPVAAIGAGVIADRWSAVGTIRGSFVILTVSYLLLYLILPVGAGIGLVWANLAVSYMAVFGLRGVYFALLEENRVPPFLTGAVAGTVSFIGYTPDVFFGPITGRILDAAPGVVGHQNYFLFMFVTALLGLLLVAWTLRLQRKMTTDSWPADASLRMRPATK